MSSKKGRKVAADDEDMELNIAEKVPKVKKEKKAKVESEEEDDAVSTPPPTVKKERKRTIQESTSSTGTGKAGKRPREEEIEEEEEEDVPVKKSKAANGTAKTTAKVAPTTAKSADGKKDASTISSSELSGKDLPPISDFRVGPDTLEILKARNITVMFPIQLKTFDAIYDGKDVVGRAKTGTGKTLAFALPIIEHLNLVDKGKKLPVGRKPRVVVLAPTRELAQQVAKEFETTGKRLSTWCFYGNSPYPPQEGAIRRGLDIVVGTTGRVKDLLERGTLNLSAVEHVILDEADEMLDMGFADDVDTILQAVPREGRSVQTLLFSATLPQWVQQVAKKYLAPDRLTVDLIGEQKTKASADVRHIAIPCHWSERNATLPDLIRVHAGQKGRTIIFCETKKEVNELAMAVAESQALHGDIPQTQRETTLAAFKAGKFRILIATDVAARGLDISGVELVIQLEPPSFTETYIHRSGRTGRGGTTGTAITFFTPRQLWSLQQIERKAGFKFERGTLPQGADLIQSAVLGAVTQLAKVHEDVLPHFASTAKELIEEHGEEKALCMALAVISGVMEPPKNRSLLCSAVDWVTVKMETNEEIRSLSYVWNAIRRCLFEESADDKVKGMRLLANKKGAVFDIPCEHEDKVAKVKDRFVRFSIPTTLPETQVVDAQQPMDQRRRFWGKSSRNDGGSGGGRGGGGGGFGGRGRGGSRGRGSFRGRN